MAGKYPQLDPRKSMLEVNLEVLARWNRIGIIEEVFKPRNTGKTFKFLEGPPTANGRQHIGHALTRTLKDTVLRYRYMSGFDISRRWGGWDCHGLAVEIEAEKHFGINSKKEIEKIGVDVFNRYCRESVFSYIDDWEESDHRLGYWVDQTKAYVTMRNEYMESEWWAVKELFSRGMVKKDYKIVPYCPRCGTSLSSHEVAQGYEDVKDPSVFVKFAEKGKENRFFLVWTTTPWTLPSNQFLAVSDRTEYSLVRFEGQELYLASSLVRSLLGESAEIIDKVKGADLVGREYVQLIPFLRETQKVFRVVPGSFVGTDEGTGIVHIAPAFGADDFEIGKTEGVSILNPVDSSGKFNSDALPWNGMFVKDADPEIITYLKRNGSLFRSEKYLHTYPFCYRCKSPLLYYPLDTWYILVSRIREKLKSNNERITWYPEHMKEGRFGNFLLEAKDWALSRNRYWGTPLPIWGCSNGHFEAIGSLEELGKRAGKVPEDLHRPGIDVIKFSCSTCSGEMTREPYVMDTWFDSGSATYAAQHYPFSSDFVPERDLPVDFISEAVDQTRGWFYVLHALATLLFDTNSYSNCLVMEFVLDENGKKMSKSVGNSTLTLDILNEVGADPLRLFLFSGAPWKTKNLDRKLIEELSRKTFSTMINVYQFYSSNANLDSYHHSLGGEPVNIMDRWLNSRLNSLIASCTDRMNAYDMHNALRDVQDFIEDLSNFYLRLSRSRFWGGGLTDEKKGAYHVLYSAIEVVSRLLAPFTPFFSDYLYQAVDGEKQSVHLEAYPSADTTCISPDLERQFSIGKEILEITRRLRQENQVKGRQPISEILVENESELAVETLESLKSDLNAKSIRFIRPEESPVQISLRAIPGKVAPLLKGDYGRLLEKFKAEPMKMAEELAASGSIMFEGVSIPGDFFEKVRQTREGFASGNGSLVGTVYLNLEIDRNLMYEGIARELIRRIQVMRKEMLLEYDEKIETTLDTGSDEIMKCLELFSEKIREETLSSELKIGPLEDGREWDIDGTTVRLGITQIPVRH